MLRKTATELFTVRAVAQFCLNDWHSISTSLTFSKNWERSCPLYLPEFTASDKKMGPVILVTLLARLVATLMLRNGTSCMRLGNLPIIMSLIEHNCVWAMSKRQCTYCFVSTVIFWKCFESTGLHVFCCLLFVVFVVLRSIVLLTRNGKFELCHHCIQWAMCYSKYLSSNFSKIVPNV